MEDKDSSSPSTSTIAVEQQQQHQEQQHHPDSPHSNNSSYEFEHVDITDVPASTEGDTNTVIANEVKHIDEKEQFLREQQELLEAEERERGGMELHIIKDEKKLTKHLTEYMKEKWRLYEKGLDYHVVAVFGSQSTGKSTLLNTLFGTNFSVMDNQRRQQTTKGLWMSVGDIPEILVMDVEGTDGRERGEDQDMERRSALFSLAIAEVLIINMFEHDIGRYNGANYGLLKTVFEVNLSLFQTDKASQKTLLLFVIRDHSTTPMKNLVDTLRTDMLKIWSEFSKPPEQENAQMNQYFDFAFFSLPHKIYQKDLFFSEVTNFRKWFSDPKSPNYVFQPQYHKQIPADGFEHYAQDVWDKVLTNKDLDLPTQRQLLAQYRCDEISKNAYAACQEHINQYTQKLDSGVIIPGLGALISEIRATVLADYDLKASKYEQSIYQDVKNSLDLTISQRLFLLFQQQLKNITRKHKEKFQGELKNAIRENSEPFNIATTKILKSVLAEFVAAAQDSVIVESQWSFTEEENGLTREFELEIETQRDIQIEKSKEKLHKLVDSHLEEVFADAFNRLENDIWSSITKAVGEINNVVSLRIKDFQNDLGLIEEHITNIREELNETLVQKLNNKLASELADMTVIAKLKRHFDRHFKFDENKRPRIWKNSESITEEFDKSKSLTKNFFDILSKPDVDISQFGSTTELTKLKDSQKQTVWAKFEEECNFSFLEAQRSVTIGITHIPPWLLVLLLVVGWNEIVFILTSPFYLLMLIVFGFALYFLYQTGLDVPAYNIAKTFVNTAMERLLEFGTERIRQHNQQNAAAARMKVD